MESSCVWFFPLFNLLHSSIGSVLLQRLRYTMSNTPTDPGVGENPLLRQPPTQERSAERYSKLGRGNEIPHQFLMCCFALQI